MQTMDKLNAFSQFLGLLSGSLNVGVSTKKHPLPGTIVLPDLDHLDDLSLDVLYGLCLREAGNLTKSKKTLKDFEVFKTEREMQAAFWVDQARVERYLTRKFGGGGDILFEHFSKHAQNPRFTEAVLGVEPKAATSDQVMLFALKWNLLGRPKFGWDKMFDAAFWTKANEFLLANESEWSAPLRSFGDSSKLAMHVLDLWYKTTKTKDESKRRVKSEQEKVVDEVNHLMESQVAAFAAAAQKKIDKLKEKAKEASDALREKQEKLAPVLDPLRQKLNQIAAAKKKYTGVEKEMKELDRLDRELSRLNAKIEKETGRKENLEERANKSSSLDERRTAFDEKMKDKEDRLNETYSDKMKSVDEMMEKIDQKMEELKERLDEAPATKVEKLEERMKNLESKKDSLEKRKEDIDQSHQEKMNAMEKAKEHFAEKETQKEASLNEKKEALAKKLDEVEKYLNALERNQSELSLEKTQHEKAVEKTLAESGVGQENGGVEKAMENLTSLREEYSKAEAEMMQATKPLEALRAAQKEASAHLRNEAKSANWEVEKMVRQVENKLAAAGIEVELSEKMETMEGWDAANSAQQSWDDKASNETKQSVINGCGGGRGTRDLMIAIEETKNLIGEIDPAQIFADVVHVSPLEGFAAAKGGDNVPPTLQNSTETAFDDMRHTVWSKRFDKVISAPKKSSALLSRLRREHASDIKKTITTFRKHLRPSFKPKFVGGREEGDLDARNLWKLASGHDQDFYEVTKKRPDTKSSASILVDLSGSVASFGDDASARLQKMVLLLSEGLSSSHIPHEILGFSAPIEPALAEMPIPANFNRKSCRLETVVLKSFKDRDLSGLESLAIQQADNSDGESVRIALDRLVKQQGKNKIMFIVSDGKPYMQDADAAILDSDLSRALLECAQKKVTVYGLGLSEIHPVMGASYVAMEEDDVKTIEKLLSGGAA